MNIFRRNTTPHQHATTSGRAAYVFGLVSNKPAFTPYFYGSKRVVTISTAENTRLELEHQNQDSKAVSRDDWSNGYRKLLPVTKSTSREIFLSS